MVEPVAVSPRSLPQSSTSRFEVRSVLALRYEQEIRKDLEAMGLFPELLTVS